MFALRLREQKREKCEKSRKFISGLIAVIRNLLVSGNRKNDVLQLAMSAVTAGHTFRMRSS